MMPASACGVDRMIGFNSHLRLTATLCTTLQDSRIPSPALVTICFGANDAVLPTEDKSDYHVPLEEFKQNLQLITEHVQVSLLRTLQC
jgi:lysophospholipase L1-like esterase